MALKKRTSKSQEQLYMLEVMIDQVTLNPEQTSEIKAQDLIVCVRFIDLPECEISIPERNPEDADDSNSFGYGKSCLFSKTPSCLIRAIRWSPLCLEVYQKEPASSTKKDRAFLGTAKMSLPACMCKHVIKAQKESKESSTPCVAKDTIDVIDYSNKIFGNVSVILRLSCFGSSIVKQFSLNEKSFVLEDSPLQKFLCPYLAHEGAKDEDGKPVLKRPDSPPRVNMNDPAFKTLTSAEKLNDSKYRELVYRTYPNEPTCCCLPTNRSTHPMKCRSGCTRPCCMKLRNPKILDTQVDRHVDDALVNTYCVSNPLPMLEQDTPSCNQTRLKGGGDIEQLYIGSVGTKWTDDADYSWYDENRNMEPRLEGGGEIKMTSCSCSGGPVPVPLRRSSSKDRNVVTMFDACKPRITSTGPKPTCVCPGKETPTWPRGAAKCMKKPCMGIDCLIRAFEEAQEFVNSIGKVPGLPGLGLMDPSESPYFGRDIDKDYVTQEPPSELQKKKTPAGTAQKPEAPRCTAPCGLTVKPSGDIRPLIPSPYAPSTTVGLPVPPRLGIVREAIPILPEVSSVTGKHKKAHEKRDEKADKHKELDHKTSGLVDMEMGPCGEPKCKSRKKRPSDTLSVAQSSTIISTKGRAKKRPKSHRKGKAPKGKSKRRRTAGGYENASGYSGGNSRSNRRDNPRSSSRGNPRSSSRGIPSGSHHRKVRTSTPYEMTGRKENERGTFNRSKQNSLGPGGDLDPISQPTINVSRGIMRYVYFVGDYYPGIVYGHRNCIDIPMRVPANMGWLWNTMATAGNLKPRIGWKPGAIGRYLYELLQEAKETSLAMEDSITSLTTRTTDRERTKIERGRFERTRGGFERGTERGRTRTTRGRTVIERDRSRIDRGRTERGKTRDLLDRTRSVPSRSRNARGRAEKGMSFQTMQQMKMEGEEEEPETPPTLHIHRKDGTYYVTMYPIRQETSGEPRLAQPMKPLQFKIVKNKDDASVASSSTASDMEIEFSPPAAVSRHRKKPNVVHVDTQVRQQEILDALKTDTGKKKGNKKQEIVNTTKTDFGKRKDKRQPERDVPKSDQGKGKSKTRGERRGKKQ